MFLFRHEAINERRQRLWGEVSLAQPPSYSFLTSVAALVAVAIGVCLAFGVFTRKETASGYLAPEAGLAHVSAARGGVVARVAVEEGASVRAGDPLIVFSTEIGRMDGVGAYNAQAASLKASLEATDQRRQAAELSYRNEAERLSVQITNNRKLLDVLERRRETQERALEISRRSTERYEVLLKQGIGALAELDNRRRTELAERGLLEEIEQRALEIRSAMADLEGQRAGQAARRTDALAAIDVERGTINQQRMDMENSESYTLVAPTTGVVTSLEARLGDSISGGSPIATIAPDGSPLEAQLFVPTRAIGFIVVGQEAKLRIHAFPQARYGVVTGQVRIIARSVLRPGDPNVPMDVREPVYRVRVKLKDPSVHNGEKRTALLPGMQLSADIVTDRRPLWRQLFDPFVDTALRIK